MLYSKRHLRRSVLTQAALCVAVFCGASPDAIANTSPSNCEALAAAAAARHGLPDGLLRAIARTESGRSQGKQGVRAWPWTSNVEGKGFYYKSKQDALSHLAAITRDGVRSFDVGCMQLNYRWHGQNFSSLEQMIDPVRNTEYAARYLKELRAETGGWEGATKYYHSRTPHLGEAYLGRVRKVLARLGPVDALADSHVVSVEPQVPAQTVEAKVRGVRDPARLGALIQLSRPAQYWQSPLLEAGTFPKMP